MSSYFCLSRERGKKWHGQSSTCPCTHSGRGVTFSRPLISCCALFFFRRGNIYIFTDKSQAIKGFIKQKMSVRTKRGKAKVPRWTGVGWGWGEEVGLAVKQSSCSTHGKPLVGGFGFSRKTRPGFRSQKGSVSPRGTPMAFPPICTISQGR